MSFFLHTKEYSEKLKDLHQHETTIDEHKWVLNQNDLAEFSSLYLDDKYRLAKAKLVEIGGVDGISFALHTHASSGLSAGDLSEEGIEKRVAQYGRNVIEKKPPKNFFMLCWDVLQDPMLIILIGCGILSIAVGLTGGHDSTCPAGTETNSCLSAEWIEGAAVLFAVCIVVIVSAVNDYQKEKQFRNMEKKSEGKKVRVIRNNDLKTIFHNDVLVGDILNIQNGDLVPCDGIVVKPIGVPKFTEASLTGETKALLKNIHDHPFIVKGSQCVSGEVLMICTGVGASTSYGKLMAGLLGDRKKQREAEERGEEYNPADESGDPCCPLFCGDDDGDSRTPLQVKLDVLASQVGYCGTAAALLLFEIIYFKEFMRNPDTPAKNAPGQTVSQVFVTSVWSGLIPLVILIPVFYLLAHGTFLATFNQITGVDMGPDEEAPEEDEEEDSANDTSSAFWDSPNLWAFIYSLVFYLAYVDLYTVCAHPNLLWQQSLMVAITIIVVAVPEGLPLAVTISLAYSMGKMYKDNNFVRVLAACETMGNATTICSDKTGTLTTNMMTVVRLYGGGKLVKEGELKKSEHDLGRIVGDDYAQLLAVSISCNSKAIEKKGLDEGRTDFEDEDEKIMYELMMEKKRVLGILLEGETNQTESACLLFAMQRLGKKDAYKQQRADYQLVKLYPFDSAIKMSSIFVKHHADEESKEKEIYRLYIKGAAERVVNACTRQAVSSGGNNLEDCKIVSFNDEEKQEAKDKMEGFARGGLRALGFGYREFRSDEIDWLRNPDTNRYEPPDDFVIAEDIIFLGLVGIKDPVRESVPKAVKSCQAAGIVVRMVTGDHLETAKHIAKECGILTNPDQECILGADFREYMNSTKEGAEKTAFMERLRVVARSRPDDKELMVRWYKEQHNDVVSVTGDGANDALALQEAHVGLAMNIQGTDVAKEASDIIIMDDNFASIVKTVKWGRCVYDNIRKFVQFQLCVNVVALTISVLGALIDGYEYPLTAVQLLWVNLIMDVLAALALATEMPTDALLDRRPYDRRTHLISYSMIRFIVVHSTIQLIILIIILFAGDSLLDLTDASHSIVVSCDANGLPEVVSNRTLKCIVFNTFVWFQIFNEVNARKVNGEWQVFEGFFDNYMFSMILFTTVILQVFIVEVGDCITQTKHLTAKQWLFCVVCGAVSFPVGQLVLWFPVDLEQGMVNVKDEWFLVDKEFVDADLQPKVESSMA